MIIVGKRLGYSVTKPSERHTPIRRHISSDVYDNDIDRQNRYTYFRRLHTQYRHNTIAANSCSYSVLFGNNLCAWLQSDKRLYRIDRKTKEVVRKYCSQKFHNLRKESLLIPYYRLFLEKKVIYK